MKKQVIVSLLTVVLTLSVSVCFAQWQILMDGSVMPDSVGWEKEKPTGDIKDPSTMSAIVDDAEIAGNKLLKMEDLDGTDRGYWIYPLDDIVPDPNTQKITVVFRAKGTEDAVAAPNQGMNVLRYCDFRVETGLYREYIKVAKDTIDLERSDQVVTPFDGTVWHIYRISIDNTTGTISIYIDEDTTPLVSFVAFDPSTKKRIRFGDSSESRMFGSYLDWAIMDLSGAYAPGEGTVIPQTLIDTGSFTSVEKADGHQPADFRLDQNYPNPFNPSTHISFSLNQAGHTTLSVYNVAGQLISTLVDDYLDSGIYEATFNAEQLPSGIYFYHIQSGAMSETRKMTLMR